MTGVSLERGIASRLALHAAVRGNGVAFRFLGRNPNSGSDLTWAELWQSGVQFAGHLIHAGLRGRQVAILCPDPRHFVISLAATILAGAVAVPMPATLSRRSAPRIRAILHAADLAAVIAPDAILDADWLAEADWPAGLQKMSVEALQTGGASCEPDPITDLATPLLVQFTSGSTKAPTGVLLSHANVSANCAAITDAYGLTVDSVGLSWLPLHHDMGLVGHVLMPMWLGGRSCIMDPLRFLQKPLRWLQAVSDERATITSAPNFAYELCTRAAAAGDALNFDLACLENAICGGEPVMPETMEGFIARFSQWGFRRAAFAPSYGLAEATLLVATGKGPEGPRSADPPARAGDAGSRRRLTSVGPPVDGTRIRIVDAASGKPVRNGEIGEIEVSGPGVGQIIGEAPREWMGTGDLGFLSAGELFVAGRSKELLILRGQNVFPADIEAATLRANPAIVPGGVAAVGVERDGTQAMVVIVETRPPMTNGSADSARSQIRESVALATGHVPDEVVLVGAGILPRTTSGKLRRAEIAGAYQSGELTSLVEQRLGNSETIASVKMYQGRVPIGDIDVTTADFALDPVPGYAHLRTVSPICWQPGAKGFLLTRFADIAQTYRHPLLGEPDFSNGWRKISRKLGIDLSPAIRLFEYMPFVHEGPRHHQLRTALAKAVAPFAHANDIFAHRVNRLLSVARQNGGFDLMEQFAGQLLCDVMSDVMELPEAVRSDIRPLAHLSWALESTLSVKQRKETTSLFSQGMASLLAHAGRTLEQPGSTLLHNIYRALPPEEEDKISATAHLAVVMLVMGNDALAACIGFAVRQLLDEGAQDRHYPQSEWASLSDDAIRFSAPVDFMNRICSADVIIAGCPFRRGERLVISPLAANHDPQVFGADAGQLAPRLRLGTGLAFGAGAHVCVGARMSRNIVHSAFQGLSALPPLKRVGPVGYGRGKVVRTFSSLPLQIGGDG